MMATAVRDEPATHLSVMDSRPKVTRDQSVRRKYSLSDFPDLKRPKRKVASTFFGLLRSPESLSWLEWFYLVISVVSIVASFVFTILRLQIINEEYKKIDKTGNVPAAATDDYISVKADYTFSILFIWTALFALYHVFFGVFCSRKGDMIIYISSATIVWVYVVVNYLSSTNKSSKELRLIVSSVLSPFIIGIGIKLAIRYSTYNQLIYALVGPDPEAQHMYRWVLFHDCVVKFDFQMAGSVLILWQQKSFLENRVDTKEIIIASVGLGLSVAWVTIAYLAVRLERKSLVHVFFGLSVVSPVEVIWNIIRLNQSNHVAISLLIATYICGAVAISTRMLSMYTMYQVSKNFHQGIKNLIFKAEATYGVGPDNNALGSN